MRNIINLNDNWIFLKGISEVPASLPENAEAVTLPHTWNAIDGQDGGNDYFRGSCCYIKEIERDALPEGELYYLEINGANSSADVYVNGKKMAHHDGGYSTWRVNITDVLTDSNRIAIVVDNAANETVYPQTADFTFYGGLYRDVNVIAVGNTHFDLDYFGGNGLRISPIMDGPDANIALNTYVTGMQAEDKIQYIITDGSGNIVEQVVSQECNFNIILNQPHLWDGVKDPYLYTAKVVILRGEEQIDSVSARAELESEIPVCKINFRFSISLARLNSGKLKLLYFSGS